VCEYSKGEKKYNGRKKVMKEGKEVTVWRVAIQKYAERERESWGGGELQRQGKHKELPPTAAMYQSDRGDVTIRSMMMMR